MKPNSKNGSNSIKSAPACGLSNGSGITILKFVFEEDLDLPRNIVEQLKGHLFDAKVPKEISQARNALGAKVKRII